MSEPSHNDSQQQQANDVPSGAPNGAAPRRPARSGEGLDSLMTRLREQEDQRLQNDPTLGIPGGGGN